MKLIDESGVVSFAGTMEPPAGGTPTLQEVLTAGGDGGQVGMTNTGGINQGPGGLQQNDGGGNTTAIDPGEVTVQGVSRVRLFGDNADPVRVRPGAGGVAVIVEATNVPSACLDPNGVPLVTADSQPQLPAAPGVTPQNIVDALVALGLVTQAP